METPEKCVESRVFIANFEPILHIVLVFQLVTLDKYIIKWKEINISS